MIEQYWTWITHFVTGNPGNSYQYQAPIGPLLTTALGNSLKLAAVAFILVVPLGILGGVVAALSIGKPLDRVLSVVGLSAMVIPEVVCGIILILIFGIWLNVLPIQASTPPGLEHRNPALSPDPARDSRWC